jgi:hypothetical protein
VLLPRSGGYEQARLWSPLGRYASGVAWAASLTITGVRVTPLRVTISGTDGSFGLRMRAAVSTGSVRIPFSADMIGVAVRRDEISVITGGTDATFLRRTEQWLSQLLVSRALALPH